MAFEIYWLLGTTEAHYWVRFLIFARSTQKLIVCNVDLTLEWLGCPYVKTFSGSVMIETIAAW